MIFTESLTYIKKISWGIMLSIHSCIIFGIGWSTQVLREYLIIAKFSESVYNINMIYQQNCYIPIDRGGIGAYEGMLKFFESPK